jgi:hypothetical protein
MQTQVSETFLMKGTDKVSIDVADSSVLPLPFLRSLSILSGCHIFNMWWPAKYEVMINWIHSISAAHWVSLLETSYLSILWNAASLAIFQA